MAIKVLKASDPALQPVHEGDKTATPTWADTARKVAGAATSALPVAGAAVAGALATPESFGAATIPAAAFGGTAGEALKQLIDRFAGLNDPPKTSLDAAHQLGVSGLSSGLQAGTMQGLAAGVAPVWSAIKGIPADLLEQATKNPTGITVGKTAAGVVKRLASGASSGAPTAPILERPAWQTWGEPPPPAAAGRAVMPDPPSVPRTSDTPDWRPRPSVSRAPIAVSPSSPMQPPAPSAPMPSIEGRPLPIYPSAGTVKGVTSNNLEAASNMALAAGHYDEAERLIDQSLQAFFHGSGGPMAGVLAAAIAHKARQVVEPLRANPAFQQAPPAKQQQMIQQALRQPGARGALTGLLGS